MTGFLILPNSTIKKTTNIDSHSKLLSKEKIDLTKINFSKQELAQNKNKDKAYCAFKLGFARISFYQTVLNIELSLEQKFDNTEIICEQIKDFEFLVTSVIIEDFTTHQIHLFNNENCIRQAILFLNKNR